MDLSRRKGQFGVNWQRFRRKLRRTVPALCLTGATSAVPLSLASRCCPLLPTADGGLSGSVVFK
jgi:hypothetical protein